MFAKKPQNIVQDPRWNQWGSGFEDSPGINRRMSPELASQLLTVFGCVTRIADAISMMPVDHFTGIGGIRREVGQRALWLDQPNPEVSWSTFAKQYVWSRLYDGNAFLVPIRNPMGRVLEVWMLDPRVVEFVRYHSGDPVIVLVNGRPFAGELIHIPGFMAPGATRGVNPIEAARMALSVGLSAQEYGKGFFDNSGVPAVVIKAKGTLSSDQKKEIREGWSMRHAGASKAGGLGILDGDGDITTLTVAPEQAQFLETRRFSSAEIAANLFKVPPHLAGVAVDGSSLTYQTLLDLYDDFRRSACQPLMTDLENAISHALLPRPQYIKLNFDVWLRALTKQRYETHSIGVNAGFLLDDEARAYEDLPPLTPEQRAQIQTTRKPTAPPPPGGSQ